ncbi:MAG: LCP family protein [Anaerolineae bacterium]|nr:LCP family protein [Anaerolineae bacterium]
MLTIPSSLQSKSSHQKLILKLLVLLLLTLSVWQISVFEARAAAPHREPPSAPVYVPLALGQLEQTAVLTASTDLTTSAAVCPTVESGWLDAYQGQVVNELFQTVAQVAGAIGPETQFTERVNILLLGSDSRPGEKFGRTDTMIVVTIDPQAKTAGMLSIPRDLWVSVPGYGESRINQAHRTGGVEGYPGGGPALAVATVEANLGVPIDFYVLVDFEGFQQVVDTLGGIDLCVPEAIDAAAYYGYTPEYVNPEEYYSFVPVSAVDPAAAAATATPGAAEETIEQSQGYEFLYIEPGWHTLDGATALTYARSRASITADFARVQRQQAVLLAIKAKALQMNAVLRLPELWQTLGQTVQTDLTLSQALQLAQLAYEIDPAQIQTTAISHDQTMSYRTTSGASVLLPKRAEIKNLVEPMFGPTNPTALPTQAEIEAGLAQPNTIAQAEPKG